MLRRLEEMWQRQALAMDSEVQQHEEKLSAAAAEAEATCQAEPAAEGDQAGDTGGLNELVSAMS